MSISKKEREAYKRGQRERKAQSNPLWYLITRSEHEGDTESEKASFKKGLRDEQLDGDKNGGGCFLTTACVEYAGLPNDCYELETLRRFRDGYIKRLANGDALLNEYYENSPKILSALFLSESYEQELTDIFKSIRKSVEYIEAGNNEAALYHYRRMYLSLASKYHKEKAYPEHST